MRHCHFSILYNELPFLKQKLPFLYKHFDQIIFYDLNIRDFTFSTDGSHEYIKNYPDPENKITLIEKTDLSDVTPYYGTSFVEKRKMFAVGSTYVNDDIDIFWCTDMDEFFNTSLIEKVEKAFEGQKRGCIILPHIIFYKTFDHVLGCEQEDSDLKFLPWTRIVKHSKGKMYGHCHQYANSIRIIDDYLYHFSFIGEQKLKHKVALYKAPKQYLDTWLNFDPKKSKFDKHGVFRNKFIHRRFNDGVIKNKRGLPSYIDKNTLMREIK